MSITKHIKEHIQLPGNTILPTKVLDRLFALAGATRINLSGVAGAGAGYPVRLVVDFTGYYNDGLSLGLVPARAPSGINDSGSIRFYSATGAELPCFAELNDAQFVTFWVKVSDNLDTDQHIYMLDSGDASAANVSNGDAVFDLFDHFNAGTLDGFKWSGAGVDFAGAGQNAYARLTGADADITLQSLESFGDGYELVVFGRYPNASAGGHGFIAAFDGQYSYYNPSSDTANTYVAKGALGSDQVSQGSRITNSSDLRVSVGRAGGEGRVIGANFVGAITTINSTGVSTDAAPVTLNHVYAAGQTGRVNYAFVRRWTGVTEPSVSSVQQMVGLHDHSGADSGGGTLNPASVASSGTVSAVQTGTVFGGFAFNANTAENTDNHGVIVNVRPTDPAATNNIGNMRFSVNGLTRWTIRKTNTVESGSNAGSDLDFQPHADNGAALGASFNAFIERATGRLGLVTSPPANATAAGRAGSITWDADYIYICVATNTWKRVAIATWP